MHIYKDLKDAIRRSNLARPPLRATALQKQRCQDRTCAGNIFCNLAKNWPSRPLPKTWPRSQTNKFGCILLGGVTMTMDHEPGL